MKQLLTLFLAASLFASCSKSVDAPASNPNEPYTSRSYKVETWANSASKMVVTLDSRNVGHVDLYWVADISFQTSLAITTNKGNHISTDVIYPYTDFGTIDGYYYWRYVTGGTFSFNMNDGEFVVDIKVTPVSGLTIPHNRKA